jgi:hypothetical protein
VPARGASRCREIIGRVYGYDPSGWHDLFAAVASASAALAGLLFVAISINLRQILAVPALPVRAATSLGALVLALVVSILILVPGQSRTVLGAELLVCGVPAWLATTYGYVRFGRAEQQSRFQYGSDLAIAQLAVVPIVWAGVSLVAGVGGGLYWLVPALIFVFISAAVKGWVLLVEVMR